MPFSQYLGTSPGYQPVIPQPPDDYPEDAAYVASPLSSPSYDVVTTAAPKIAYDPVSNPIINPGVIQTTPVVVKPINTVQPQPVTTSGYQATGVTSPVVTAPLARNVGLANAVPVTSPEEPPIGGNDTGVGSQAEPAYSYAQVTAPLTQAEQAITNKALPGWVWLAALGVAVALWLD